MEENKNLEYEKAINDIKSIKRLVHHGNTMINMRTSRINVSTEELKKKMEKHDKHLSILIALNCLTMLLGFLKLFDRHD